MGVKIFHQGSKDPVRNMKHGLSRPAPMAETQLRQTTEVGLRKGMVDPQKEKKRKGNAFEEECKLLSELQIDAPSRGGGGSTSSIERT